MCRKGKTTLLHPCGSDMNHVRIWLVSSALDSVEGRSWTARTIITSRGCQRSPLPRRCADNVRNPLASQVPRAAVARAPGKGGTSRGKTDRCCCCGQVWHRRPDCPRRNESCSLCGKRGHLSQVCRSSGGNARARAVEAEPAEPEEEREIQLVWALSVCDISGIPSDESENLLNMIMDSGAEEHVVSLADWKSLGEPLLKPALKFACAMRLVTTCEFLAVFVVRGWCDNQMVELTALVATRAARSLSVFSNETGEWSCVAVEAVAYCFNVAVSVNSFPSEKKSRDQCHHLFHHEARGPVSQD